MSDVRLIDANALKEEINAFYDEHFKGLVPTGLIEYAQAVDSFIDNAPTVEPSKTDYLDGWDGEYYGEDC